MSKKKGNYLSLVGSIGNISCRKLFYQGEAK